MALSESDQILKNLHSKSQLKPHEIIEAKAKLKNWLPEKVDLSKNKVLQKAKKNKLQRREMISWFSVMASVVP